MASDAGTPTLKPVLGTFSLWGIAVGLVISGEYFGWNFGLEKAGSVGFLLATSGVALLYTALILSLAELSTSIPHAGGPFAYATRAMGPLYGFVTGLATLIEFLFAPPAIALAIGSYLALQFPVDPKLIALGAYVVFLVLNAVGVGIAALFELFVTLVAVAELLLFAVITSRGFSLATFTRHAWAHPGGFDAAALAGIFASLPFAIWFFLAIEGAAMAAEEAKEPARTIPRAFLAGIATLVVLAFLVMIIAGGATDTLELAKVNHPLPVAMKAALGDESGWVHMLIWIGLFGLVASLHGIILGYSRQLFALARAGYLPRVLAWTHPTRQTPVAAIFGGGVVGLLAISSDELGTFGGQSLTANLVVLSVMGALTMYVLVMIALVRLRAKEPDLPRPYRTPLYPLLPAVAMVGSVVSLASVVYFNRALAVVYCALLALGCLYFSLTRPARARAPRDAQLEAPGSTRE